MAVAFSWPCKVSVAVYSKWGRKVLAPRPNCARCGAPMAFDGGYPRWVREAGKCYSVFVRRARCRGCGIGEALLPDFVLARRRDSTAAVGAAVLASAGAVLAEGSTCLYQDVPARTVRSWRHRFAERAGELSRFFEALAAERGASALPGRLAGAPAEQAVVAIGRSWQAAHRRTGEVLPAWFLANLVVGSGLLGARVDLPWPCKSRHICRSRAP